MLEAGERRRERAAFAVRPKPHVHAENVAVRGRVVQRGHDAAAEAVEILAIGDRPRSRRVAFLGIHEHEVDVGRHVELAAAQLAHADDDQLLPMAGLGPHRRAVDRIERPGMHAKRFAQGGIGKHGHGRADLGQRCAAREVAQHRVQEHALAQAPQACGEPCLIVPGEGACVGPHEGRLEAGHHFLAQVGIRREGAVGVAAEFERAGEVHAMG